MIVCLRENGRLAKLSIIDDANASRKMLVVFAGAGRTSITFKGHLGISIAVAVLANILSLASAFLPTTTLSHQSGNILNDSDSNSNRISLISSGQYKASCLSRGCFFACSIRKKIKMFKVKY